jgi:hypothetical protein
MSVFLLSELELWREREANVTRWNPTFIKRGEEKFKKIEKSVRIGLLQFREIKEGRRESATYHLQVEIEFSVLKRCLWGD